MYRLTLNVLLFAYGGLCLSGTAVAQNGGGGGSSSGRTGISIATGAMALFNSTSQGGQGAQGSTILTQTDISYHDNWWAAGVYIQYDKQGDSQTDYAAGPRLELAFEPFYIEIGYALQMDRYYIDRAVAEQSGGSTHFGLGVRTKLGASAWFLQSSYKYRTQKISTQDGKELDEPITQTDGYPLFGIGVGF